MAAVGSRVMDRPVGGGGGIGSTLISESYTKINNILKHIILLYHTIYLMEQLIIHCCWCQWEVVSLELEVAVVDLYEVCVLLLRIIR